MQASDIMTFNLSGCSAHDSLQGVATIILVQADLEHSNARSQKEKVPQCVSTPH